MCYMRIHKSHPQLHTIEIVQTVYAFNCAECGSEYYVRGAWTQADGTLRCGQCAEKQPHGWPVHYYWCPRCRQAKRDCEKHWPSHRGQWCLDCSAAEKNPEPVTATCQHCGDSFNPKRRDARYCSTRCRTAAHRAKR